MKSFLYEALDQNGQKRQGSVVASNVADARFQLTRMGLRQIRVLSSEMELFDAQKVDLSSEAVARIVVQSQSDSLPMALLRIIRGNALIWLPFVLWSLWCLYVGPPFNWVDYLAFSLTALSLWVVLKLLMPSAFYTKLLEYRVQGDFEKALRLAGIATRLLGRGDFIQKAIAQERAKVLAALGRLDEAQACLDGVMARLSDDEQLAARTAVAESARQYDRLLELSEQMYRRHPDKAEAALDYASALLFFTDRIDEARRIAAGFHPNALNELSRAGLLNVQALLAWHEGQLPEVIAKVQAIEGVLAAFMGNPLARGYLYQVQAYKANALRRMGKTAEADALWQQVGPLLCRHDAERWPKIYAHLST